jgi:antitoxin YefM
MTTIAISDFRSNLPSLVDQVSESLKRFVITVSGKPKAVVMSFDELESLEETAEILSTPGILKSIRESQKQIRKGEFITLKDIEKKYGLVGDPSNV